MARVYEGDDGPVLKALLMDRVLPLALETGDRWLAHWGFGMLARWDEAVRALVVGFFPASVLFSASLVFCFTRFIARFINTS